MKNYINRQLKQHKELRYIISGGASEVIEYGSFFMLLTLTHMLVLSNSVSFILGIASGFVFHKLWSFAGEQQFKTHLQLVTYICLATFNFFMVNILVVLFVDRLHFAPGLAKILTMMITAAWSYLMFNKIIFRHVQPKNR